VFFKPSPRTLAIGLLVFSSLWMAFTVAPLVYSLLFPQRDFQDILHALESHETVPFRVSVMVPRTILAARPLRRALQVGYYTRFTVTVRLNASHKTKETQVTYLAWFQGLPRPSILAISRHESDGVLQGYDIDEGEPASLVRSYGLPMLMLGVSVYLVRRKREA